jgi:flagellar protein FliO/FliZ
MFYRLLALFFLLIDSSLLLAEPIANAVKPLPSPVTGGTVLQWFFGLVVVLVIIVGCSWLLRKYANISRGNGSGLKILGGVSVGSREKVLLIQAGKKQLVIGVAPGQVRTLHVLEGGELASDEFSEGGTTPSFSEHLKQITGKQKP